LHIVPKSAVFESLVELNIFSFRSGPQEKEHFERQQSVENQERWNQHKKTVVEQVEQQKLLLVNTKTTIEIVPAIGAQLFCQFLNC